MLNAKNKRMLTFFGALFGAAVLVFAFLRARKQSEATKTPISKTIQEELKTILTAQ